MASIANILRPSFGNFLIKEFHIKTKEKTLPAMGNNGNVMISGKCEEVVERLSDDL